MEQKDAHGAPFIFGVRVKGDNFTDRKAETERLRGEFPSRSQYNSHITAKNREDLSCR